MYTINGTYKAAQPVEASASTPPAIPAPAPQGDSTKNRKKKRIAVIGGGVAGCVTAYALKNDPEQRFEVELFEARDYLGGAVRSKVFKSPEGEDVVVDTGVVFIEESFYSNFCHLLALPEFAIETSSDDLGVTGTFATADGRGEEVWSNSTKGLPLRAKFRDEANRFRMMIGKLGDTPNPERLWLITAEDWLRENGFSDEFVQKAIIPMLLAFAITRNGLLSVPIAILHVYFGGGALEFNNSGYARRALRGMSEYMDKMHRLLGDSIVHLRHRVTQITRRKDGDGVDLVLQHGERAISRHFDEVVVTIYKDQALTAMGDSATPEERAIFSEITYEDMDVYVHYDPKVLSPALFIDGKWRYQFFNYRYLGDDFGNYILGATTYVPRHDGDRPTETVQLPLLTYANTKGMPGVVLPEEHTVVDKFRFRHVIQSIPMYRACMALHTINGKDRIWYAGNDTVINFHEAAFCSGLSIAKALGVPYPFASDFKASWLFNILDAYMMQGRPPMELLYLRPH